ncbi:hypothetical protein JCM18694_23360 [Prolixibacter denitrificans]|uniref:Uncharacterized protein n=1 Tax=Prolixibacter denitrificans TaxID=1541063 RepID=A0ABQ0ZKZ5_9BACT|nr:hypothetical protein JCM18694_23360 [Prolixibacter denitrificans]
MELNRYFDGGNRDAGLGSHHIHIGVIFCQNEAGNRQQRLNAIYSTRFGVDALTRIPNPPIGLGVMNIYPALPEINKETALG